jgi:adenosylcobyric acid synthase
VKPLWAAAHGKDGKSRDEPASQETCPHPILILSLLGAEAGDVVRAKSLMIQGTSSSAGKSLLTAALCRIFRDQGVRVCPFKSQNMALNSFVTPEGLEIGRAQAVQARAAGVPPSVDMNPILLKPETDSRSQVVLMGRPWKTLPAGEYERVKPELWRHVTGALDRLGSEYDLLVIEGAGSPAEINLAKGDIVNMRVALHLGSPVFLAANIDLGGVFASLVGTIALLQPEERKLVKGFIINKFRGDLDILKPGLHMLAERTEGRPTLGVVPYIHGLRLAEEDSVFLEGRGYVGAGGEVDLAAIKLPHMSNFDDLDALCLEEGVRVRLVERASDLGTPAAVIVPGTKTTLDDLSWLSARGFPDAIRALAARGVSVVGLCGGYQMLGRKVGDPDRLEGNREEAPGLDLLPVETRLAPVKVTRALSGRVTAAGGFSSLGERVEGYEIHMGRTAAAPGAEGLFMLEDGTPDGAATADGKVWGTYLHGVFDLPAFRRGWLESLGWKPRGAGESLSTVREKELDKLADVVRGSLDMDLVRRMVGI